MVGLGRLELPTSRLSSARSNQLSYKPEAPFEARGRLRRASWEEREARAATSRKVIPDWDRCSKLFARRAGRLSVGENP
jgi:hypothetical protein